MSCRSCPLRFPLQLLHVHLRRVVPQQHALTSQTVILLVAAREYAMTTGMMMSGVLPRHRLGVPYQPNRRRPISSVWQTRHPDVVNV